MFWHLGNWILLGFVLALILCRFECPYVCERQRKGDQHQQQHRTIPAVVTLSLPKRNALKSIHCAYYSLHCIQKMKEREKQRREKRASLVFPLYSCSGWINHTKATTEKWTWLIMYAVWISHIPLHNTKKKVSAQCLKLGFLSQSNFINNDASGEFQRVRNC